MTALNDEESAGLVHDKSPAARSAGSSPSVFRRYRSFCLFIVLATIVIGGIVRVGLQNNNNQGEGVKGADDDNIDYSNIEDLPGGEDPTDLSSSKQVNQPSRGADDKVHKMLENQQTVDKVEPESSEKEAAEAEKQAETLENQAMYEDNLLQLQECAKLNPKDFDKGSYEYAYHSANCGWGYDFQGSPAKDEPWSVVLMGADWREAVMYLSACQVGMGRCPNSPNCSIRHTTKPELLAKADVFVSYQTDAEKTMPLVPTDKSRTRYRVLYFREGHTPHPPDYVVDKFDFEMGVHYYSEIINPNFLKRPIELLKRVFPPMPPLEIIPVELKTKFAMSVMSDCGAESRRDTYVNRLSKAIQPFHVNRYGKCGNLKLPPKPLFNAAKLIAEHKFYLSFENIIQDGYVSEKLFHVMTIPTIPIYYGALNVPNVTTIPSYIKVSDFATPEKLAVYLKYLVANPDEYNKYHVWRDMSGKYFTREFLETVSRKIPGPAEVAQYPLDQYGKDFKRFPLCCRLCDRGYVEWAKAERKANKDKARVSKWTVNQMARRFFGGRFAGP